MQSLSRSVVFINTNEEMNRVSVTKSTEQLCQLHDNNQDVFCKSIIDRYKNRPHCLESLCLAEFAAKYSPDYNQHFEDNMDGLLPSPESDLING